MDGHRAVRVADARGYAELLLAECVERERIRIRDWMDWRELRARMSPDERACLDRSVAVFRLDYVLRRMVAD